MFEKQEKNNTNPPVDSPKAVKGIWFGLKPENTPPPPHHLLYR